MSADKSCRVTLYNAPDCEDWRETLWANDLGIVDGKRMVELRNTPVGASFDGACPNWGDTIVVKELNGRLSFDLQNGVIVKRYTEVNNERIQG